MSQETDDLFARLGDLKAKFFDQYHTNIDKNRRSYNRLYADDVVPYANQSSLKPLLPQTSRRAIDESADHILYIPKVKAPIRPTTSKHITEREIAESKRAFLNAFWSQVSYRYNPLGDGRKPLLREGRICIKHTLKWDVIPDRTTMSARQYKAAMDKLGRYEFLWMDELLDNKSVYEDPTNHRDPAYVYLQYEILVQDAKTAFEKDLDATAPGDSVRWAWMNLPLYNSIKYTEMWTRPKFKADGTWEPGKFLQWVEDQLVSPETQENPYPYIPIAIDDAGYGDNYRGTEVYLKYVGLAEHSYDMFVAEAQQMTSWNAASGIIAFPPIKAWNMDETRNINVGPGAITTLSGDKGQPGAEDFEFTQWPEVPQAVLALVDKTTQYANSALKMDTLGGLPLRGVDTATEADQQIRNASSKLEGPLAAMSRIAVKISRWVLMDIELVLETGVTIYGTKAIDPEVVSLAPKDIKGYYDVSCEFTTSDADSISQMKARFWLEMYRVSPFLSAMTAMERGEVADDPMAEMQKRAAEDILLSPEMRQIRLMSAAQQFGKLTEMLNALQAQAAGGDMSQVGIPGGTTPGANSAEGMMQQSAPQGNDLFAQSLMARDITQGASQLQ